MDDACVMDDIYSSAGVMDDTIAIATAKNANRSNDNNDIFIGARTRARTIALSRSACDRIRESDVELTSRSCSSSW